MESEIKSKELSEFVRGLGEKAEIVNERKIYYPFYRATIIKKDTKKEMCLDAVTGRIIKVSQ